VRNGLCGYVILYFSIEQSLEFSFVVAINVLLAQRFVCQNGRKNTSISVKMEGKVLLASISKTVGKSRSFETKITALGFEHDPENERRSIKWKVTESDRKLKLVAQNVINSFLSA
jgi:hypothetical protein